MNNSEKYGYFSVDITLNYTGYDHQELHDLMQEPFCTLYPTRIGYQWHPAAVGENLIEICLIISATIGGAIAGGFLAEIGSDLYNWTKSSLKKVLKGKESFDDSRIHITFQDTTISVYTNTKEEIIIVMENFERIVDKAWEKKGDEKDIELEIEEITDERNEE